MFFLCGNFTQLNRLVTCTVLKAKANDRRTSSPLLDEFRGPRSDFVRQVALATTTTCVSSQTISSCKDRGYPNG
ncbi:hypothetical protein TNCV_4030761 [Trichonephila clavipes]|nr:hypothetical protein TNCV_4030761 [Trichonephila clavipes]